MPVPYTDWTEDLIRELLDLSAEGLTRSQIGVRMGLSKGAVCGCVTRLKAKGLTVVSNPPTRLVYGPPDLAKLRRHHMRIMPPPPPPAPPVTLPPLAAVDEAPSVHREAPSPQHPGSECAFIFGSRPHYRFCGEPCVLNARGLPSPWCQEHYSLTCVGVPALRRDAA